MGGVPSSWEDRFVIHNHGHEIKEITKEEYFRLKLYRNVVWSFGVSLLGFVALEGLLKVSPSKRLTDGVGS